MDICIDNHKIPETVRAVSSKSAAHRALICAALSDSVCRIVCSDLNDDIKATISVLEILGCETELCSGEIVITPPKSFPENEVTLDCGESGTTLRLMLPVCAALGVNAVFIGKGRLMRRPIQPLLDCLQKHGVTVNLTAESIRISGKLTPGDFVIPTDVSSQFVSGLLLALPIAGGRIIPVGESVSRPYIDMTIAVQRGFSVNITEENGAFQTEDNARYSLNDRYIIEGDWSNAAFWLAAGAIGEHGVTVTGLDPHSVQGDREILTILEQFGADVHTGSDRASVAPSKLHGITIDARNIPDLVPILSVTAMFAEGDTIITGVTRLKHKESDRVRAILDMLLAFGVMGDAHDDVLIIHGQGGVTHGGTVNGAGDHRIVMSGAAGAIGCHKPVAILGAEAVRKSYPEFFDNLR